MDDELKTDEVLLSALRSATDHKPSSEEMDQQRISFVMGSVKPESGLTRAKVQEIIAEQEGKKDG